MTSGAATVQRGELIGGHYQLERILGQGGMGTVWAARDLRLGRSVAIKFLGEAAAASESQRIRFAREARLASRIRSQHVVHVFGDGTTPTGVPYVVMELLEGESLATHIARLKRCALEDTAAILEQVCRGLSAAHREGLVHRDIKPANIFLTPQSDGSVFVRLLDFGIAKEVGVDLHALTQSGEVLGTGYYMSPEQLRAPRTVGPLTDVWALGVVVYEMLTGRVPFDATTFPGLVVCVVEGKFSPPSQLCPELPKAIDSFMARALQVDSSQRFGSVDELGAAFSRIARAHSSQAVLKPEVVRVLRAHASATYRMPMRMRIQDLTTKYLAREASGPRRAAVTLFLLTGLVIALRLALPWWSGAPPSTTTVQQPATAPAPTAQSATRAVRASVAAPVAGSNAPSVQPAPAINMGLGAAPAPLAAPTTPGKGPSRHRRDPEKPQVSPLAADVPVESSSLTGAEDEHKYGF